MLLAVGFPPPVIANIDSWRAVVGDGVPRGHIDWCCPHLYITLTCITGEYNQSTLSPVITDSGKNSVTHTHISDITLPTVITLLKYRLAVPLLR